MHNSLKYDPLTYSEAEQCLNDLLEKVYEAIVKPPYLNSYHLLFVQSSEALSLDCVLKSYWELESLGIKSVEISVHEVFKESVVFRDGRYKVTLPCWDNLIRPPSNFQLAKKRLLGLLKKLCHHPEVLQEYHAIIQEQL